MADVTKSILFTVGTVGAAQSAAKMGALASKVAIVGTAVAAATAKLIEMANEAQKLARAFDEVDIPLGRFGEQTGGLVNTMDMLQGAIKLQQAGIQVTEEQFAALGAAATSLGQKLGETPEGITTRFNKLVRAVVKGSEGPLLEYGIQLDETEDKVVAQAEALDKLADSYGNVAVEAETAEEAMFAFKNSADTIVGLVFNETIDMWTEALGEMILGVDGGIGSMQQFESDIIATDGALLRWMSTSEGQINTLQRMWFKITDNTDALAEANAAYERQVSLLTKVANLTGQLDVHTQMASISQQMVAPGTTAEEFNRLAAQYKNLAGRADNLSAEQQEILGHIKEPLATGETKKRKRRGGGRGGGDSQDMVFTDEEVLGPQIDQLMVIEERSPLPLILGPEAREKARQEEESANAEILKQMQMLNDEREAIHQLELDRIEAEKKARIEGATASAQTVGGVFDNLASAIGTSSEAAFNANKAFAISSAIIEGTLASIAGFRSVMQSVPYPANVILAPITAASIAAATGAQIARIASTKFGGSGGRPSAPSPSFPTGAAGGATGGDGGNNYTFNVNVEGQTVFSSMVRENELAAQNGQAHFTTGQ
jgi:hypothetical protein